MDIVLDSSHKTLSNSSNAFNYAPIKDASQSVRDGTQR